MGHTAIYLVSPTGTRILAGTVRGTDEAARRNALAQGAAWARAWARQGRGTYTVETE
jgi:Proprotein convertase P-domain